MTIYVGHISTVEGFIFICFWSEIISKFFIRFLWVCCQQVTDLLNKFQRKSQIIGNQFRRLVFGKKLKAYDGDLDLLSVLY